jgi:hypothetical protein
VRLSLCPLLNLLESEGAHASSAFALTETPSVQSVSSLSVSASRDVLQRLQVPKFAA